MRPIPLNPVVLPGPVMDAVVGGSWLTAWWVPAIALLTALTLTGWILLRGRRRERSWWSSVLSVTGAVVVWLVMAALAANSWFAVVPDGTALQRQVASLLGRQVSYRTADGGNVEERSVPASRTLAMPESSVWVYTPPGYDPAGTTRYPVVYLIHGYPGTSADWFTLGRADQIVEAMIRTNMVPSAIVVAPDVNGGGIRDGECLNSLDVGPQVESWLYQELVPWVDASLLTQPDWRHRVLGGMSAGGYCALDQGLRHPDVWGGIAALEGYGDPGKPAAAAMGYDHAAFERVSPAHYVSSMKFPRTIPIFLDAGELADPDRVERLAADLQARGQDVLFQTEAGQGHTWATARLGLPYGLLHVVAALGWK